MLFTEFNMDEALRVRGEEGFEDGKAIGKLSSEIRTIRKKLAKNMSVSEIAELLELDESYISSIAVFIQNVPDKNDIQIAELYLKEHDSIF